MLSILAIVLGSVQVVPTVALIDAVDQKPEYRLVIPDDVAEAIDRRLGSNPLPDADLRAWLGTTGPPDALYVHLYARLPSAARGDPATGTWVSGHIVTVEVKGVERERNPNAEMPTFVAGGIVKIRVPDKGGKGPDRAVSLPFTLRLTPTVPLSKEWNPRAYPIDGNVEWGESTDIRPEEVPVP